MLSAALYNTGRNVNLVSKEGEWNETLWINENIEKKENIENADVNNSLITNMADVAQWNILLGKNECSWANNSQSELPHAPKGLNRGPKMGPRRHVNKKTAWWGQENAADNKMAKQNGDKRNYCVGHNVLKTRQEQVF